MLEIQTLRSKNFGLTCAKTGREAEFAEVAELITTHRLVTLIGAEGNGDRNCHLLAARPIASSGSAPAAIPLTDRGVKPQATAAGCHLARISHTGFVFGRR